ncbi:lipid II flippase MurJ [Candidatus Liberibacter asiaticus]
MRLVGLDWEIICRESVFVSMLVRMKVGSCANEACSKFFHAGGIRISKSLSWVCTCESYGCSLLLGKITDALYTVAYVEFIFVRLAARGDGVIHNSFIPMFSQRREQNGSENAWRLSSEVFSVLLPILMVMIMVIELVLPLLVRYVMAPGFPYQSDEYFLTVQLSRVVMPSIFFISLASLVTGILFASGRYFIACMPSMVIHILPIFVLTYALCYGSNMHKAEMIYLLCWGVFLAHAVYFWILYLSAKKSGVELRFQYPRLTCNVKLFLS